MTTAKEPPLESTGIKLTEYYCMRPKPDCNDQKLQQCEYCEWFVQQIKRARQEGFKEGKGK